MSEVPPFDVFFGHASAVEARLYVRLRGSRHAALVVGAVEGPFSEYAHTLPAKFPLRARGEGLGPLAEAVVPDPCFWTPDAPYTYRVTAGEQGGPPREEQLAGIRPLVAAGPHLFWASRRCVLRGLALSEEAVGPIGPWHESRATLLVDSPSEQLCAAASKLGVLIAARIPADMATESAAGRAEIERLSRWPAVGLCVVSADCGEASKWDGFPRHLLLAEYFPPGTEVVPRPEADVVLCEDSSPARLVTRIAEVALPTIAVAGPTFGDCDLSAWDTDTWRTGCDRVQRALAPESDLAGYLVQLQPSGLE